MDRKVIDLRPSKKTFATLKLQILKSLKRKKVKTSLRIAKKSYGP